MAEFHDGKGGWGFVAHGHINTTSRFWVRINDQPGNCWDSGSAATPSTAKTSQSLTPGRMTESDALSRTIEHKLAEAQPAATLPLAEANQALQQALAGQLAHMEEEEKVWASTASADIPRGSKKDAELKEKYDQLNEQNVKIRQALASARIAQLTRCGTVQEAGNSALICDGHIDLVDTCGQPQHVRDLLVFQQQGGKLIAGDSTQVLYKSIHECRARP